MKVRIFFVKISTPSIRKLVCTQMVKHLKNALSRNEPCFCGSGKRFKRCHGAYSVNRSDAPIENWHVVPQYVRDAFDQRQIERAKHYKKGNFQRPPLIEGNEGNRFIVRGQHVFHWKGTGTFLNFLEEDLIRELGEAVFTNDAHPLHVWRKAMRVQAEVRHNQGISGRIISTVATMNFLTVAHDLFTVADNTDLRERLVKSLRIADQFHGARHELLVASCLVRAGFTVEFSDETDSTQRHSDATAAHRRTGCRYFVEMKAKGRQGILGKAGLRPSPEEMKGDVSRLLRDALEKPAQGERLIFIDMNLPPPPPSWAGKGLWWQYDAVSSIHAVEAQPGKVAPNVSAFIVFTNLPSYQMPMEDYYTGLEVAFTGFRKPDFASETTLLGDRYPDIASLFDAFSTHDLVPDSLW